MSQKYPKRKQSQKSPLLPILFGVGGLVLVALAAFSLRGGQQAKVPVVEKGASSIQMDKEKVDLGAVKLGQMVEVSFQVSNRGDQPLRITEAPYVEVVEGC